MHHLCTLIDPNTTYVTTCCHFHRLPIHYIFCTVGNSFEEPNLMKKNDCNKKNKMHLQVLVQSLQIRIKVQWVESHHLEMRLVAKMMRTTI